MSKSTHQEGMDMRNEIIAYVKSLNPAPPQVDVTHLVERYIKIGDSFETAKDILQKNGFSFTEKENRTDVMVTYRIHASYKMEGDWWYNRTIMIFLGNSPESEKIDSVRAKVNLKTI
jgi:hypothetical protein